MHACRIRLTRAPLFLANLVFLAASWRRRSVCEHQGCGGPTAALAEDRRGISTTSARSSGDEERLLTIELLPAVRPQHSGLPPYT
jgi:hypothetical protein